jgi:hypothetical protein
MARARISNAVYRLKHGKTVQIPGIPDPLVLRDGEEFHIVGDVLYMHGAMLAPGLQDPIINWIIKNPLLFVADTRNF